MKSSLIEWQPTLAEYSRIDLIIHVTDVRKTDDMDKMKNNT